MRRMGMFEEIKSPDTDITYRVVAGRGPYNVVKSSDGQEFRARSADPHLLDWENDMARRESNPHGLTMSRRW